MSPLAKLVWLVLAVTPGASAQIIGGLLDVPADDVLTALADLAALDLASHDKAAIDQT